MAKQAHLNQNPNRVTSGNTIAERLKLAPSDKTCSSRIKMGGGWGHFLVADALYVFSTERYNNDEAVGR